VHLAARPSLLGAALLAATLLTACTASPVAGPTPTTDYTPPAWMAQAQESAERKAVALNSCLDDAGIGITAVADGGSIAMSGDLGSRDVSEAEGAARRDAEDKAMERCIMDLEAAFPVAEQSNEVRYDQMTQTAECVRANGYPEIGEPPSRAAWVDAYDDGSPQLWSPYQQVYRLHPDITEEAWRSLRAVCADGGVTFTLTFDDPSTTS